MKKTIKFMLSALLVGMLASPHGYAASTGHYTDLLPNPTSAPGVTSGTLYYNGYDWGISSLGATNIPGDALSRSPITSFQSSATATIANTATVSTITALPGLGFVGSASFPAAWIATGRTIRISTAGKYSTSTGTWTWDLFLGTTPVLSTLAQTTVGSQTDQFFKTQALMTIGAVGNAGTVNATYDVQVDSGPTPSTVVNFSTATAAAVTVDLTSQLTVRPRFTWGSPTTTNTITFTNILIELLN